MAIGLVYLRMILSRWRLVLALVFGCTLVAWGVSVFYLATRPKFEAAARLNIVPTSEELGYASRFVRGSTFDGGAVMLGTYAEYAHTRPVVAPIVDRYIARAAAASGQSVPAWTAANTSVGGFSPGRIVAILNYGAAPDVPLREQIIDEVVKRTTIENVEGTYLIRLAVEWEDADGAAWFANALADAIIARADAMSRSTGREIAGTLESRLLERRAALAGTLKRSRDLKSRIGVVDIDRQKTSLLEARLTEQAQLTTDRANLDSAQSQVAALRAQAGGKLSSAQATLDQTIATEAPRAAGLARSVAIREGRIGQIDRQIASIGGVEDQVKALDDQAVALQAEVTALTERVSFSQTENLANVARIDLIERAVPPLVRSSPKVLVNTVLGFIAGCALAGCALLLLGPKRREPAVEEDLPAAIPLHRSAPSRAATYGNAALAVAPVARERRYPGVVPRPAADDRYSRDEVAMLMRGLGPWLDDALAADARPVFVGALGGDLDARRLYQLLFSHLREQGVALSTIDGTRTDPAAGDGVAKPLVYLGGMAGAMPADTLVRLPAGGHLILAAGPGDRSAAIGDGPLDAHVVTIAG